MSNNSLVAVGDKEHTSFNLGTILRSFCYDLRQESIYFYYFLLINYFSFI